MNLQTSADNHHIWKQIAKSQHHEMEGRHITVSIGIHPYVQGQTKENWFKDADSALYRAKKNGKNRIEVL